MSSKVPKACLAGLARKVRENPDKLKNLVFADAQTSQTTVKTQDLRLDVHENTTNPNMATGIIQANSQAENKAVRNFLKGSTCSHKGTHQIIGEKISFGLGSLFDVEAVAGAIERGGDSDGEAATGAATEGTTGNTSSQLGWIWSAEHGHYYRTKSDGTYEWWEAPATASVGEWVWSHEHRRNYCRKAD